MLLNCSNTYYIKSNTKNNKSNTYYILCVTTMKGSVFDMATKRLIDTIQEQETLEEQEIERKSETRKPVEKIISKDGAKDKQISAKVNMKMYNAFTTINKAQGISNNSALNMLIAKYVRENRVILNEENIM